MNKLSHTSGGGGVASYIDATQPPQPLLRNGCATPTQPLIERYENALRTIPAPGTGCHSALLGVANLGILAGVRERDLLADIRAAIPATGRTVPDSEIMDAIRKAAADVVPAGECTRREFRKPAPAPKPPFDGMTYRQRLIHQGDGALECDFMEMSGGTLPGDPVDDTVHLLNALYSPSDVLFIGETMDTAVDTVERILARLAKGKPVPPHIIPNPMTGTLGLNKEGKPSRRCDATVARYRFAVVEFDEMAKGDQLAFWHSVITRRLLPVAVLIDSGGKSIHSWLEVNLPNADAWKREIRSGLYHPITGRMALMGADRACQNPSRLSRLPGHKRGGSFQRLIYMNTMLLKP